MWPPGHSATTTSVLNSSLDPNVFGGSQVVRRAKYSVETTDENITVSLEKTRCMMKYRKGTSGLSVFHMRGDESAPIRQAEFHARAWQLANERARALGWIE